MYQNAAQTGNLYQFRKKTSNFPLIENLSSLIDTLFKANSSLVFAGGPTDADQVIAYAFALSDINSISEEVFAQLRMISYYCDQRRLPEEVYFPDSKSVVETKSLSEDQKNQILKSVRDKVYLIEALGGDPEMKKDLRPILKMVLEWIDSGDFEIPEQFKEIYDLKVKQIYSDAEAIIESGALRINNEFILIDTRNIQSDPLRVPVLGRFNADSFYIAISKYVEESVVDLTTTNQFIITLETRAPINGNYIGIRQIPFHPNSLNSPINLKSQDDLLFDLNTAEKQKLSELIVQGLKEPNSTIKPWGFGDCAGGSPIGTNLDLEVVMQLLREHLE